MSCTRSSAASASWRLSHSGFRPNAARSRFIAAITTSSFVVARSAKPDSGAAMASATASAMRLFLFIGFPESCDFGRAVESQAVCLIALAHRASKQWPLVIAANRDEFFARPARAAQWWDDAPDVFGGRDLQAGGSWMAITRGGRFAMVTNVRGFPEPDQARSRGALVADFVKGDAPPLEYAREVERARYAGFPLVCGEAGGVVAHVSSDEAARGLEPGIFAVSNAPAAIDWPKIAYAREA